MEWISFEGNLPEDRVLEERAMGSAPDGTYCFLIYPLGIEETNGCSYIPVYYYEEIIR